ncbi:SDR family oxidoreductase [Microbacterium sp. YY-01]|uniref:SDR family oxidoreductase n=1 Tax=Microbacterium sp. YY-01 TaxID=3421634 RepID=UPI003D1687F9
MNYDDLPLLGKTALVTGVSRRRGIGFAVARRLATLGANLCIHHFADHDRQQPWGGDQLDAVRAELRSAQVDGATFTDVSADLSDSASVTAVIERATTLTGTIEILVCNQAVSGTDGSILDMTPSRLDTHWSVNTRATLLLTSEFARRKAGVHDGDSPRHPGEKITKTEQFSQPTGHVIWLTSGQLHGPMVGEVAYAASKAALAGVTATVAAELLQLGIVLNTINPGPVNTGYMDPETTDRSLDALEEYRASTPFGRYGQPTDPANLVGWLVSSEGSWIVGQVMTSDGGFSLI